MSKPTSGVGFCEHGVTVRINTDGTMLTACRECYERIKQLGWLPAADTPAPPQEEGT